MILDEKKGINMLFHGFVTIRVIYHIDLESFTEQSFFVSTD